MEWSAVMASAIVGGFQLRRRSLNGVNDGEKVGSASCGRPFTGCSGRISRLDSRGMTVADGSVPDVPASSLKSDFST